MSLLRRRRTRLRLLLIIPWLPPALGRRTRPLPLTRNRFLAVLFVFIFGMTRLAAAPRGRPEEPELFRAPLGCGAPGYGGWPGDCQAEPWVRGITHEMG